MTRLPILSGTEAIRRFCSMGYTIVRQRGSHVRLVHQTDSIRKPLTVPKHKEIRKGLLRKLLRDAGTTVSEFSSLKK